MAACDPCRQSETATTQDPRPSAPSQGNSTTTSALWSGVTWTTADSPSSLQPEH
ncbi:unnamed protein product [Ectocarpus sp. 4 AP-2014]